MTVSVQQSLGKRDNQEDSYLVEQETPGDPSSHLLMLLADGMGGHAAGEVASRLAVDAFRAHFLSESRRPRERLEASLRQANEAIAERVAETPELHGMGCTLIGTLKVGNRLVWVSVGDSLLLLFRGGTLRRLNADHSVFGELMALVAQGKLTEAEARRHPRRNALRSAVVGGELPLVDINAIELAGGDVVVLATDGMETLSDRQIGDVLRRAEGHAPETASVALVAAVEALDRPGQDNTTVMVYRHEGDAAPLAEGPPAAARRAPLAAIESLSPASRMAAVAGLALVALAGTTAAYFLGDAPDAVPPPAATPAARVVERPTQEPAPEPTGGGDPVVGAPPEDAPPEDEGPPTEPAAEDPADGAEAEPPANATEPGEGAAAPEEEARAAAQPDPSVASGDGDADAAMKAEPGPDGTAADVPQPREESISGTGEAAADETQSTRPREAERR